MSDDRAKVLRRLKKIMALSKSSNEGEAAAALHQAHRLMAAHGLTNQDVADSEVNAATSTLQSVFLTDWESALVDVVCSALQVKALVHRFVGKGTKSKALIEFIGCGPRAEIAGYAFETLRRRLKADLRAAQHETLKEMGVETVKLSVLSASIRRKWRKAYAIGWCHKVKSQIANLEPISEEVGAAIARYIEAKGALPARDDAKQPRKRASVQDDTAAFFMRQGFNDAKHVQLNKAMSAGNQNTSRLSA